LESGGVPVARRATAWIPLRITFPLAMTERKQTSVAEDRRTEPMIVCPSCQKVNPGNPPRCEACGMSFTRMSEEAKSGTARSLRKNTRMTRNGLISIGAFMAGAVICNLPYSVSSVGVISACGIFGAVFGFPIGYALTVIKGDLKKGAILGAVVGVLFGLVLSMIAKESVISLSMLRGIASGAVGGLAAALLTRRQGG